MDNQMMDNYSQPVTLLVLSMALALKMGQRLSDVKIHENSSPEWTVLVLVYSSMSRIRSGQQILVVISDHLKSLKKQICKKKHC